jgi:hypothetical protein
MQLIYIFLQRSTFLDRIGQHSLSAPGLIANSLVRFARMINYVMCTPNLRVCWLVEDNLLCPYETRGLERYVHTYATHRAPAGTALTNLTPSFCPFSLSSALTRHGGFGVSVTSCCLCCLTLLLCFAHSTMGRGIQAKCEDLKSARLRAT